jgi:hypothetical protein
MVIGARVSGAHVSPMQHAALAGASGSRTVVMLPYSHNSSMSVYASIDRRR